MNIKSLIIKFKSLSFNEILGFIIATIILKAFSLIPQYTLELKFLIDSCSANGWKIFEENTKRKKVHLNFNGKSLKFLLRKRSSDIGVFNHVIIKQEYFALTVLINERNLADQIKNIIDGGANIGCTAIYFSSFYENSTIICVEPDASNFTILNENLLYNYKGSKIIAKKGGIWGEKTNLVMNRTFRDGRNTSFKLEEKNDLPSDIESITITEIMDQYQWDSIDILKLDIEGGEKSIFEKTKELEKFIYYVKFICLEVHEEFVSIETIQTILDNYGFECFMSGELLIGENKSSRKRSKA